MALVLPEPISNATPEDPDPHVALNNWSAGANPAVTDDSTAGYEAGSFWFNVVVPYRFWVCTDAAEGAAVWREIGVERFNSFVTAVAGEDLAAQDLINLYNDGGTLKGRKANATTNAKPCDGFVAYAVLSGEPFIVNLGRGVVQTSLSGLTVGAALYLSTTGGAMTGTAPSASGNIVQRVGIALSATSALINPELTVEVS